VRALLQSIPLLRTPNLEEARAFYAVKGTGFEPRTPRGAASPLLRVNGLFLRSVWFGYVSFEGAAVALRLAADSSSFRALDGRKASLRPSAALLGDYYLHLPIRGAFNVAVRGRVVDGTPASGIITSPGPEQTMLAEPDAARLSVSIRGAALNAHLAALLGETPRLPVRFAPQINLDGPRARGFANILRSTALDLDENGSALADAMATARFEDFVMSWLLLAQPNNYSEALARRGPRIAPREVRRTVEFIHEHLAQPLSLADLVAASGVAGRTLLKHFGDAQGKSPMRYLRDLRMQRVHEALRSGGAATVAGAAQRCGFTHLGRFAVEYRMRFGESPSATLAKAGYALRRVAGERRLEKVE
jgi:AraC-like DNA-binding protein